jgi:hypothetical protein
MEDLLCIVHHFSRKLVYMCYERVISDYHEDFICEETNLEVAS